MFNRKPAQPKISSLLGANCVIRGTVEFSGGMEILGRVEGDIVGDGSPSSVVVVGREGAVKGNISAANVIVSGSVNGRIDCSAKVSIAQTGSVNGDVSYGALSVEAGGTIMGKACPIAQGKEAPAVESQA